jgi:dienelactone hydrolase
MNVKPGVLLIKTFSVMVIFLLCSTAHAGIEFKAGRDGDHFVYLPNSQARNILVIAHGMYKENRSPVDVARTFISRWTEYADKHNLILIAPVFDDSQFGTLSQGYGGYRNLFGKYVPADEFVNDLVGKYSPYTSRKSTRFYLYGHSAGAQFTVRYVVTHPNKTIKAVISAAGRYSYPTKAVKWPYGAGDLTKTIKWDSGQIVQKVNVTKRLADYALAAEKTAIVIGRADTKPQPVRPGHIGSNRIEFAKSWSAAMNALAVAYGKQGKVTVNIVDGIGHNSRRLTPYCAEALFAGD